MQNWKRHSWIGAVALCAVIALVVGCGDDNNDNNNNGNGGGVGTIKSGTWALTASATATGGGGCQGFPQTTLNFPLCDVNDPGDISGDEGDCETHQEGSTVTFDCDAQEVMGGCTITHHTMGSGTFGAEHFDMTVMNFDTVSPASAECLAQADPCTTSTHIIGNYVNSSGCSTAGGTIPLSRLFRTAGKLAGTR